MTEVFKIPGKYLIETYHICFSYLTKRGNKKTRTFEINASSKDMAEQLFYVFIQDFNERNSFKAYSNVEILDMQRTNVELFSC